MKIFTAIGLFIFSCLFFSCEKELLTGEVSGKVYFAGTRIPIPEVKVKIDSKESITNRTGEYFLKNTLGRYYILAEKDGFDSYSDEIRIVNGSKVLDIGLRSEEFTCLVYGAALGNHSGKAFSGLEVLILNPDASESEIRSYTDLNGNFQLPLVPRGERVLVVKEFGVIIYREVLLLDDAEYSLEIFMPEPFTFVDIRDGHEYDALMIGRQTWMIENLAWLPSVSNSGVGSYNDPFYYVFEYEGSDHIEAKNSDYYWNYGVFYNWEAAKVSCPDGWHLPSDDDWKALELFLGMSSFDVDSDGGRLDGHLGYKMKSTSAWINNGHGDNSSKFNVLPIGSRLDKGGFDTFGFRAIFWTSTESSDVFSWGRGFAGNVNWVDRDRYDLQNGLSVRCIMD